jgi:ubiquinone/menaquinone biosynthesis C-methylase UbiE
MTPLLEAQYKRRRETQFLYVVLSLFLPSTHLVDAYVSNNSGQTRNELSTLPISDPKIMESMQHASKVVTSMEQLDLVDTMTAPANNAQEFVETHPGAQSPAVPPNVKRQRWGVDNTNHKEYWFDHRIHTLGNVGFSGALHAAMAPISTKLIDILAYNGQDVRHMVADDLKEMVKTGKTRILDLCCGVGTSTRALRNAFPDAETVIGVDTSNEMISMAQFLSDHYSVVKPFAQEYMQFLSPLGERWFANTEQCQKQNSDQSKEMVDILNSISCSIPKNKSPIRATFACGNAECTPFPEQSFNLITIMYAFHEAPSEGRDRMLREAHRLLEPGGTLAVVDIHSEFKPSRSMLMGEPYVKEYQQNIHNQLKHFQGFSRSFYKNIVPGHVGMWILKRVASEA